MFERRRSAKLGRFSLTLCVAFLLESLSPGLAGAKGLVVRLDRGGVIRDRSDEIERLTASGQRVELRGKCYSSCTMYLGLQNVCLSPEAILGFHGPSLSGQPMVAPQFDYWSEIMARHYREPLRSWFMQTARHSLVDYYQLRGSDLIAMGYHRC